MIKWISGSEKTEEFQMIIVDTSLPEGGTLNNLSPFNDLLPKKKKKKD